MVDYRQTVDTDRTLIVVQIEGIFDIKVFWEINMIQSFIQFQLVILVFFYIRDNILFL